MPLQPDSPFPKGRGDAIRSKDWNDTVAEVIRLDRAKLDSAGGSVAGNLAVAGNVSANGTISGNLAANSVGTGQLVNGGVTAVKLANNAVGQTHVPPGAFPVDRLLGQFHFRNLEVTLAQASTPGSRREVYIWFGDGLTNQICPLVFLASVGSTPGQHKASAFDYTIRRETDVDGVNAQVLVFQNIYANAVTIRLTVYLLAIQ